jgi:hypothetical protein
MPYGDLCYKALFLSPFKGFGVDLPLGEGARVFQAKPLTPAQGFRYALANIGRSRPRFRRN